MSLIEVLISMFVMLFGLMGVAAIFPVGNFYVVEGEKFDLASGIAQNAFEELRARGMLRPEAWIYPTEYRPFNNKALEFIIPGSEEFTYNSSVGQNGPGSVLVIDPLGSSIPPANSTEANRKIYFPYSARTARNPWTNGQGGYNGVSLIVSDGAGAPYVPIEWPVRRVTLRTPDPTITLPYLQMSSEIAETIFRLRDDLAVEQPDESDRPSIQRWDVDASVTPNTLLRRQYKGDYSWLATIVPTTGEGLAALQPANADYGEISYDVSVVVFRKRDFTPSITSERLIEAELLQGGELVIFSTDPDDAIAKQQVDDALDDIRSGNWISLMGVNQTTGDFIMKWYRLLAMDDETTEIDVVSTDSLQQGRRAMLIGPDWPASGAVTNTTGTALTNLRAGLFPGAISVVTKPLRMEDTSLWKLE